MWYILNKELLINGHAHAQLVSRCVHARGYTFIQTARPFTHTHTHTHTHTDFIHIHTKCKHTWSWYEELYNNIDTFVWTTDVQNVFFKRGPISSLTKTYSKDTHTCPHTRIHTLRHTHTHAHIYNNYDSRLNSILCTGKCFVVNTCPSIWRKRGPQTIQ